MIPFSFADLCSTASAHLQDISIAPQTNAHDLIIDLVSTSSNDDFANHHALFIPLKGERFDGHDFIEDAIRNGAKIVAVQQDHQHIDLSYLQSLGVSVISCPDTLCLYGLCAKTVRKKSLATVSAITGSCGKTTVKEMLASIFAAQSSLNQVLFTHANFNNDVGVPKTLLSLTMEHVYAVVEQGASHLQDIARTSAFIDSHAVLITNVGQAHIEGFGSSEGVYHGKSEIIDELFSRYIQGKVKLNDHAYAGIACIPADSQYFGKWQQDYDLFANNGSLLSFGESEHAHMRVSNISCSKNSVQCQLDCNIDEFAFHEVVTLPLIGRHNAINAAGAALLARVLGASSKAIVSGLQEMQNISGRLSLLEFPHVTLIDDAYNASFNAVLAAIDTLETLDGERVFVFGDMGELGQDALKLHQEVGSHAQKIDCMLCNGTLAKESALHMGKNAVHFEKQADLIAHLLGKIQAAQNSDGHITILIKGSHAMHMDKIVSAVKTYMQA